MQRRNFLWVVGQACTAIGLAPGTVGAAAGENGQVPSLSSGQSGSAASESDWETVSAQMDRASSTYIEPWDDATCRTLMKGGYLGNGDFGVHLGGTRHSLKYYRGKNGFHAGNDVAGFWSGEEIAPGQYKQHILNLARLTIEASSGAGPGTAYSVTQDLKNAEIRSDSSMGGARVQAKAYLSASRNVLVVELFTNGGVNVPLHATLSVIGNAYVAKNAGAGRNGFRITFDPGMKTLALVETKIPFALQPAEDLELRVFLDKSIIEVFANDRLAALAPHRYAPGNLGVSLFSEGGSVRVKEVKGWKLRSIYAGTSRSEQL